MTENKQMFSDYSGKYHGKLNNKKSENKHKCNCKTKGLNRELSELKGKHNER